MKTSIITIAFLSLNLFTSGQKTNTNESFTKININNNAKVIIRQDSVCSVKIADDDQHSYSQSKISNGTLMIDGIFSKDINVTMPVLQQIEIEGVGSVTGETRFTVDELVLKIDGDGKITLDVTANKINTEISGVGKIVLKGSADEVNFSIPGSGKIDALSLKTNRCNINISGLGKCEVDVIDELNTNISGTGTVTYKTLPKTMNKKITGIGNIKNNTKDDSITSINPDTTRISFGEDQVWFIGKKDIMHNRKHKIKPIWSGFEMGLNSYVDNNGSFTMRPGNENFELRAEKSVSVGLNILQDQVELGRSNVWVFTGLGITWNNYRFASNVVLENGPYTNANVDSSPDIGHIKSKLVAIYLTAPLMIEAFTSHDMKNALHLGVGGIFGLRIGSHTKQKLDIDGDISKRKEFDDFNLNPFRYGFRAAIGYRKFNIYADYYASTLFKNNKGPELYPVNIGITFIGF